MSLSPDDLRRVIRKHLPAWLKACAAHADAIVMHGEAFGTSERELFLFACAIKYATHKGKTVHVTSSREREILHPGLHASSSFDVIYREERGRIGTAGKARRKGNT